MEQNGNQYLHTAPWQKVLISIAAIFAIAGILAFIYIWMQRGSEGNFWDRFMTEEQEQIIYTEEQKLDVLRALRAEEGTVQMAPEEEAEEVERKEEVLQAVSASSKDQNEETPAEQEKLDILEALRNAE